MNKNRGLTPLAVVLMLSGSLALTGCDDKPAQQGAQHMPEVGIVTLKSAPLQITTELPGRTSAYRIAEVRPQVSGIILKRNFVEGSDIQAGVSLYQIDPATYQASYDSAKGDLAKAQAAANMDQLTVKRYQKLLGTKYISQQDYDTAVATAQQSNAAVVAAKAAVETARINLAYTKVTSPISGRIGKSAVTEGALVQNGQTTALATVQQLDPIYVDVTQSSKEILSLKKDIASGKLKTKGGAIPVTLIMEDGTKYPQTGELTLSEVSVDPGTGTITLRAEFPNPDNILLPGMFVRTELPQGTMEKALLVPQRAVMREANGTPYVYVVEDGKIAIRRLVTHRTQGQNWIVEEGLKPGEKVVVEGLQRIRPGVPVQIVPTMAEQEQAKAAKASKQ